MKNFRYLSNVDLKAYAVVLMQAQMASIEERNFYQEHADCFNRRGAEYQSCIDSIKTRYERFDAIDKELASRA